MNDRLLAVGLQIELDPAVATCRVGIDAGITTATKSFDNQELKFLLAESSEVGIGKRSVKSSAVEKFVLLRQ